MILQYDKTKWEERPIDVANTLQLFITNKCNRRCRGCFYGQRLGSDDMTLNYYKALVEKYRVDISANKGIFATKVTLIGGEPTIHPDILAMIKFNQERGLKTTIYSNGYKLKQFEGVDLTDVKFRIGVLGVTKGEKTLLQVDRTSLPITVVYMLRKDNVDELLESAYVAEKEFNCNSFFISSIRDIETTGSFWIDTPETLSPAEYFDVVQKFMDEYKGNIGKIHISKRGAVDSEMPIVDKCRFLNIFPNGERVICPFDISLNKTVDEYEFGTRQCTKHSQCLLYKILLFKK